MRTSCDDAMTDGLCQAHRQSLRSTLQACRMPQADALLHATVESVEHWVEEVFAQAQARKWVATIELYSLTELCVL